MVFGDLVGNPIVSISQTFSDIPGSLYQVSFDLFFHGEGMGFEALINQNEGFGVTTTDQIWASFYHIPDFQIIINDPDTNNAMNGRFNFMFVGTGSDTLTFLGFGGSNGLGLANANVSAVPEPSIWLMLLLGFVSLGFAYRRSRRNAAFA
jgi:hypothetical protein